MNIYGKLAAAREEFHGMDLKKTGMNKFAGYKYFELADFIIPGMEAMKNNGLCPVVSFTGELSSMVIHEIDGDGFIEITSPYAEANLKGCHPIQNLGAVETYQRRYLWMAALEIVEHDAIDSAKPVEEIAYTPEQKAHYDKLLESDNAIGLFAFLSKLDTSTKVALYNSFEQGQKVAGKKKVDDMEKQGADLIESTLEAITGYTQDQDDLGVREVLDELSKDEKALIWKRLPKIEKDFINDIYKDKAA